jgi:hypothetical protein
MEIVANVWKFKREEAFNGIIYCFLWQRAETCFHSYWCVAAHFEREMLYQSGSVQFAKLLSQLRTSNVSTAEQERWQWSSVSRTERFIPADTSNDVYRSCRRLGRSQYRSVYASTGYRTHVVQLVAHSMYWPSSLNSLALTYWKTTVQINHKTVRRATEGEETRSYDDIHKTSRLICSNTFRRFGPDRAVAGVNFQS